MQPWRRRNTLGAVGLVVAAIIAVVLPLAYATFEYRERSDVLAFKAQLSAAKVAKYIYGRENLWQYQSVRLDEVLELPVGAGTLRQRVIDSSGKVVFDNDRKLVPPVMRSTVPIVVGSTTVGGLITEESLDGFVKDVLLWVLASTVLAVAAYMGFRALPLRALDDTIAELEVQNRRFDVALSNMSQGLCVFDKNRRLVVCNSRYASLYDLPAELTRPGTPLEDIVGYRLATGRYAGASPQEHARSIDAMVAAGTPSTHVYDMWDGRSIFVKFEPLGGGGWVATHEDITEQRRAEAHIAHLAHHDPLTDLPNRVLLSKRLEETRRVVAGGGSVAVLCLDLDRFKEVNDTLGHPIGDALLKALAKRLRECVRETDTIARVGGDEFAIVQAGAAQPQAATALAVRIIEAITAPIEIDGHHIVVGTSVGISVAPSDTDDTAQLFKYADMALYQVKGQGRGTYRFFEPAMDALMHERRQMEIDLRAAVSDGGFELYYQPIINLDENRVSTFEALLRWHRPHRGVVSPGEFIPLAEETGLIAQIGEWVLRTACAQAASWPADVRVSVNLSPAQFKHLQLAAVVAQALADGGLPADRLELEITESILLESTEETLAILRALRNAGVRIAMDDFGIGFSSLRSLRIFPFDKIKIDRSFVRDLDKAEPAGAIVEAIAMLGARLDMTITAEGVETSDQLSWVRALGVTEVQGYYVSRPRPASDIPAMLAAASLTAREAA
ncbi:MAG: EAL domain-containing protein [Hyphomicrobiaceae bacterium]